MEPYYKNNSCKLYQCDNLELLRSIQDNYIDLIYIDPPFSVGKIFKTKENKIAFEDKYTLSELIDFLVPRIIEIKRVLKNTGSFYLHGDFRFIPYIRVECDKIFGIENFRNEIIWCYGAGRSKDNIWATKHDTILFYSKTENYTWNQLFDEKTKSKIKDYWNIPSIADKSGYLKQKDDNEDFIYPTQKPIKLLERIIMGNSIENNIVADFFMGGGTTGEVALNLKRKFIGCDKGEESCKITKERLDKFITP